MQRKVTNKTGVWIDFDRAYLVKISDKNEKVNMINSNIEHFQVHGGSRSKTTYGPQDKVSESKFLARKKQQEKDFYKKVMEKIDPTDQIIVFGPAEAKTGLKKMLDQDSNFKEKEIAVETAEPMTENQLKAWVRNYTG